MVAQVDCDYQQLGLSSLPRPTDRILTSNIDLQSQQSYGHLLQKLKWKQMHGQMDREMEVIALLDSLKRSVNMPSLYKI